MSTQNANKISVLIIDNHPLLRVGVRTILKNTQDISVIGETGCEKDAKILLGELCPTVILLDLKVPYFSPTAFVKWTRESYPEAATLILTDHKRDAYLAKMMDAGAIGYLCKETGEEQLINAIRRAASGENLYDEQQKMKVLKWRNEVEKKWNSLSEREKQVLWLLARGLSNKEISSKLYISLKTVDKHLEGIYQKIEAASRAQAVYWGIQNSRDFPYCRFCEIKYY